MIRSPYWDTIYKLGKEQGRKDQLEGKPFLQFLQVVYLPD